MVKPLPEDEYGPNFDFREYSLFDKPQMLEAVKKSVFEAYVCEPVGLHLSISQVQMFFAVQDMHGRESSPTLTVVPQSIIVGVMVTVGTIIIMACITSITCVIITLSYAFCRFPISISAVCIAAPCCQQCT